MVNVTNELNFIPLQGDDLGVYHNENYRIVETDSGNITFSYTKHGKGMALHLASTKSGLKRLKMASIAFCDWMFNNYDCECLFAVIKKPSIKRMVNKIGFNLIATDNKQQGIYMKTRDSMSQVEV